MATTQKINSFEALKEQASISGYSPIFKRNKKGARILDWESTINEWSEEIDNRCKTDKFTDFSEIGTEQTGYQCHKDEINENVPNFCQLKKCTKTELKKVYSEREKSEQRTNPEDDYWNELDKQEKQTMPKKPKKSTKKEREKKLSAIISDDKIESLSKKLRAKFKRRFKKSFGKWFGKNTPENKKILNSIQKSSSTTKQIKEKISKPKKQSRLKNSNSGLKNPNSGESSKLDRILGAVNRIEQTTTSNLQYTMASYDRLDKLSKIQSLLGQIENKLSNPNIISTQNEYQPDLIDEDVF
jgi:hypothetical protein